MNRQPASNRQHGVALILSLLLLLIMTLIGVAAMSSTIMQERMAGNARVQAMVFEGASAGVSSAIEFMRDVDNWSEVPDPKLCGIVGTGKGWGPTQWTEVERNGPLSIEQRMYCIEHPTDPNLLPSQLFVLSRGSMVGDNGSTAMREIEIRMNEAKPGDPTCAICAVGEVDNVGAASSNSLKVDGSCGPAITTSSQEGALTFLDALKDDRIGNYQGGIVSGDIGNPWTDPQLLAEFVYWAKLGLNKGSPDNSDPVQYFSDAHYNVTGEKNFGTPGAPQITYFDGDVKMGGNVSGAGILIVNGDLQWGGTPAFQGLILVLGGDITVGGGGGGGNPAGTIIVTNLDADHGDGDPDSPMPDFSTADFAEDGITFQWNGGGTEAFTYDCGLLEEYRDDDVHVKLHPNAREMWDVRCDCYGIGPGTPEVVISSWRENIGWRDEFFGTDDS